MRRELELKFSIPDEKEFVSTLSSEGISFSNPVVQTDTIFFRVGKGFSDLHSGEPVVRIRQTPNSITTTLKVYKNGVSDRAEVECGIFDAGTFRQYLELLDLAAIVTVKKSRQRAKFQGASIVLDHVDNLGVFAEIEILSDDENVVDDMKRLHKIVAMLGLDPNQAVKTPYDEMLFAKQQLGHS